MAKKVRKDRFAIVIIILVIIILGIVKLGMGVAKLNAPKDKKPETKTTQEINEEKAKIIRIAIDPAKGGINKGRQLMEGGMSEKDLSLDLAKRIRGNLAMHSDIHVILTRSYDENKGLKERAEFANKNNADILVSIRMNAEANGDEANGISTYYPTLKPLKKDEGASIAKKDDELEEEKKEEVEERDQLSEDLAKYIQKTTASYVTMSDRGIINQSFDILQYVNMPSVIIHCGFITNREDCKNISKESVREELSKGISEGILMFVDKYREPIIKDRVNFK